MKKLLTLVLVLSLASLASATTITVSISGPTTLAPSATGTYTISYSGIDILSADVDVISDSGDQPYGIGNGVILPTNADTALNVTGINGATGNYELAVMDDITALDLGGDLFTFDWTASATPGTYTISMIENSFIDLNWEAIGIDNSDVVSLGDIDVLVTPEPMTLALLGLGGLFIRRKK